MKLSEKRVDGFVILQIEGRVNTANYHELETKVNELLAQAENKLLFNCQGLEYISSSGLRVFLMTQKKMMQRQGVLYLCALQPTIAEIFDISGFTRIFKIFANEAEAVTA